MCVRKSFERSTILCPKFDDIFYDGSHFKSNAPAGVLINPHLLRMRQEFMWV